MALFLKDKLSLTRSSKPERGNFLYGFIGDNDTGKSVTAARKAKVWRESRPSHYKIIAHDPQGRYPFADYTINPMDEKWAKRLENFQDILLILDDFRLINENPIPVKGLTKVLYDRFKNNVDIIYTCHNPMQVINTLTYYTSHYFIFYGNYKQEDFIKKFPNPNLSIGAAIEINKYVHNFGRGQYPIFPYVYVDSQKRQITGINMSNNLMNIK